ncbi:MAG: hypothetical protein KKE24_01770 [Candidatus Thermoplasmatota archaeon]|nr:hypothetical protein [Candidatus Thermoplasmatota archaeon]
MDDSPINCQGDLAEDRCLNMIPRKLSAYVLVLLMTTTAFAFVSWPAGASEGGADAYGYTWTDSNSPNPTVSFNWIDINSTGTDVGFYSYFENDVSSEISIGFSFPFYDDVYTSAYVSTNGFISFTSASYEYWNYPIPDYYDPNALVAPYWDNLVVFYPDYNSGAVFYETIGTAPDRQFVVQWDEITRGYNYDRMTFELILNETGEIWFQYLTMSGLDGSSATIGIENSDGTYGSEYGYNEAVITDGLAIMFEQGPIGFGPDQQSYGDPGDYVSYDLSIRNNGLTTESYDIELDWSDLGWNVEMYDAVYSGLADNNGNSLPDTGDLLPGEEYWMIVEVLIPDTPTSLFETTVLKASAYSDPTVNDTATLVTQSASIVYVPPHSDSVYDSDSDGDYDYLVVNISIWSFQDQSAYLYLSLYSPSLYYLFGSTDYVYVLEGFSNITLYLPSENIYDSHENGSFYVSPFLYDAEWNSIGYSDFYTSSYNYDDFDPPGVLFSTPYSDHGLDIDGDSYYDELVVNITLQVLKDGYYTIEVYVDDYYGDYITYLTDGWDLSTGETVVQLSIPGSDIYDSGLDGPYNLYLYLYDDSNSTDSDFYETGAYSCTDFDGPDIMFAPPHEDYAVDTDGDFYFNEVVIEVYIDCLSAGYYDLVIYIYDYWYYEFDYIDETLYFDAGVSTYYVVLDSYSIITNGVSGEFYLEMHLADSSTFEELDYNYYSTGYYYLSNFDPLGAYFESPHDDYGRDDDSDGLYDYLVFAINVRASYTGWYVIEAYIYDPDWNYEFMTVDIYLEEDVLTVVELEVDSYRVWEAGYDGYWYVYLDMYDYYSYAYYDSDYYYTDDYYMVDFDPLPVVFSYPHYDYALDVDDDYLYDYLIVDVLLECYESGEYTLWADLYDPWGYYITTVSVTESLSIGTRTVELTFDGWLLGMSGVSGYYYLEMWIEDEGGYTLDYDEYYTDDYYYWYDFAGIPAEFSPPHSDHAVDSDGDLLYEFLVVTASVESYVSGEYLVYGVLYDEYDDPIDVVFVEVQLDVDVYEVELWFDAWTIAVAGGDPWYVNLVLADSNENTMDSENYYLGATYYSTDFDPTVPSMESGWAYEPPVVDGAVSADEWFGAGVIDFVIVDAMNEVAAKMYILNDDANLYILIDATGDTTETYGDGASVAFDTDDDTIASDGREDQFVLEATEFGTDSYHLVFDSYYWDWITDCAPFDELLTDHDGLAGAIGFNSSPDSSTAHRIYEFSIPLALLMLSPGDPIGFAALSSMDPGVYDASDSVYSTWPAFFWDEPELDMYGTLTLSEEPPLTTVDLAGTEGENGWYISDVEVTLTAAGGTGGVNSTYYSLDGGAWTEYTDSFTVTADGSHTLRYYSDDMAGNEEPVRTVKIGIDRHAPTATAAPSGTVGDNEWYTSGVSVVLAGSDPSGSGVSVLRYRIDGGAWVNYTSAISISDDGEHTIEFFAIDVAGNEGSTNELTFNIDTVAPETTATVSGSTVTLTASDGTSGVNVTMYRIDGGEWVVYTAPFEVTGSGNHTVEFYSTDDAGNAGEIELIYLENASGIFGLESTVFFLQMALLAMIVAIIVIVLIVMRNKRKGAGPTQFHDSSIPADQVDGSQPAGPDQELPPPPEQ